MKSKSVLVQVPVRVIVKLHAINEGMKNGKSLYIIE